MEAGDFGFFLVKCEDGWKFSGFTSLLLLVSSIFHVSFYILIVKKIVAKL